MKNFFFLFFIETVYVTVIKRRMYCIYASMVWEIRSVSESVSIFTWVCVLFFLKNRQCHGIRLKHFKCFVFNVMLLLCFFSSSSILSSGYFVLFLRIGLACFALVSFGFWDRTYACDRFVRSFHSSSMDHMSCLSVLVFLFAFHTLRLFRYIQCILCTQNITLFSLSLPLLFSGWFGLFFSTCRVNVFVMPCNFGVLGPCNREIEIERFVYF